MASCMSLLTASASAPPTSVGHCIDMHSLAKVLDHKMNISKRLTDGHAAGFTVHVNARGEGDAVGVLLRAVGAIPLGREVVQLKSLGNLPKHAQVHVLANAIRTWTMSHMACVATMFPFRLNSAQDERDKHSVQQDGC
jgi:hypothetical protein